MEKKYDFPLDGEMTRSKALRLFVGEEMLKGAGVAAVMIFGPLIFIWLLYLLSLLLPEESQMAPDPTPNSFGAYEVVLDRMAT